MKIFTLRPDIFTLNFNFTLSGTLRSKPMGCAVNPGFKDVTDVCIVR